jgi:hypothetical protein
MSYMWKRWLSVLPILAMDTQPSDMVDLLGKLASAIATAEGYFVQGSVPQRNNNPGDLRAAPWLTSPKIIGNFFVFATPAQGISGLYHQIALDVSRGLTLRQLIGKWAPPTDGNDTQNYLQETARRVGITDLDQPLQELLEITHIP